MKVDQVNIESIPIVAMDHRGDYATLDKVFGQLYGWLEGNGIATKRTIGIYWDNPQYTPIEELRSSACAEVEPGFALPEGAPMGIRVGQVDGGRYAFTTFQGPYPDLEGIWEALIDYVENTEGQTISEKPSFEVYLNDPADTPPDQLITELYLPLA